MPTFAERQRDLEEGRYLDKPKFDVSTKDGAQALLGQKEAKMWASQLIARIDRNGVVPFVTTGSHIIEALQTLNLVEIDEQPHRTTVVRLTDQGRKLAAQRKAAQRMDA